MQTYASGGPGFTLALANEEATRRFASDVADMLKPGDFIALAGDLGAGKTTFARAVIGHLANDAAIEVPSPSFTLVQHYDLPRLPVVHADLYRLAGPDELAELGLNEFADAVVVMEWPERAAGALPQNRIDIAFALSPRDGIGHRVVKMAGHGAAAARVDRLGAMRRFLDEAGFGAAVRTRIAGDASTRSYERLVLGGKRLILMNSPGMPDGPPIKRGLPYSAIAHLAEDVKPFVAIANGLRKRGFSAPKILAVDLDAGFMALEDLGTELVVAGEVPVPITERYERAIDVLIELHGRDLPAVLPVAGAGLHGDCAASFSPPPCGEGLAVRGERGDTAVPQPPDPPPQLSPTKEGGVIAARSERKLAPTGGAPQTEYHIPPYDPDAFLIEVELLIDWYLPLRGAAATAETRVLFLSLWRDALRPALDAPQTWVLRDFHSPNLLWLEDRSGFAQIGLLDFQDAVMGPAAYDVASLLQDARVDVTEELETALFGRYARARCAHDPDFDPDAFGRLYATLAAQRATKILGIFARLDRRDGKPQYLRHLPRIYAYLRRALNHPSLAALHDWYLSHVPPP